MSSRKRKANAKPRHQRREGSVRLKEAKNEFLSWKRGVESFDVETFSGHPELIALSSKSGRPDFSPHPRCPVTESHDSFSPVDGVAVTEHQPSGSDC